MATLTLSIALDPSLLLERAVRGLFPLAVPDDAQPWPTLRAWLVLRQGGLRDDLHRLAASHGVAGWFDPPVCVFAELHQRWMPEHAVSLSEEERIALLSTIVARHAHGVFDVSGNSDAWVPVIDRLIGELAGEGVLPEEFEHAQAVRTDRDAFERLRDERLAAIYHEWRSALTRHGRADDRGRLIRLAESITRDPVGFADLLGGRRDIRIVGLADVRGGWRQLLIALASCPAIDRVTIFASHALELPASLAVEREDDVATGSLASTLFGSLTPDASACQASALQLLEAPDAVREIEQVAVRVRALLDAGTPAHRIAILMRQARPGVTRMAAALQHIGVPVTARRRTALLHTGPAKALRALLSAAAEGFSRHALVEIAEQPLLSLSLDAGVLQAAGELSPIQSLEEWAPALEQLLARARARDHAPEGRTWGTNLPATSRVATTLERWTAWLPQATALTLARTDAEWFAWVRDVLSQERWGVESALRAPPADDADVWRDDVRSCERILALSASWMTALDQYQDANQDAHRRMDAAAFLQRLTLVLDADLITLPDTGFGVVVSEALAAGWRAFDHVFVMGMSAGAFPMRHPPGALFTERDRRALIAAGVAFDAPGAWRAREQELFRVLCAAARIALTVSWPSMDGDGREVARSAYVDDVIGRIVAAWTFETEDALLTAGFLTRVSTHEVLTPGYPLTDDQHARHAPEHAARVASIEAQRFAQPGPYDGVLQDAELLERLRARFGESYLWSATQLEALATCSWSWFANRLLGLEERGELDDGLEPTVRGALLHDALQRFFESARRRTNEPAYLLPEHEDWARPLLASAFDDAWTAASAISWLGHPALHALTRRELLAQLERYLEFEITLNSKRMDYRTNSSKMIHAGAAEGELTFGPVWLEGDDVRFQLRGMIDRIDVCVDDRVDNAPHYFAALDYKSTVFATPAAGHKSGWDDGVVLQVPLYARALQVLRPDAVLARLEYRTLRNPQVVHQLQLVKIERNSKTKAVTVVHDDAAAQKLDAALDAAGRRVRQAREGAFPVSPTQSCGCSPYCVARDICRIPGGPIGAAR
jgi:hypothetical protein